MNILRRMRLLLFVFVIFFSSYSPAHAGSYSLKKILAIAKTYFGSARIATRRNSKKVAESIDNVVSTRVVRQKTGNTGAFEATFTRAPENYIFVPMERSDRHVEVVRRSR